MAKAKTKFVVVLLQSIITRHSFAAVRARTADKMEMLSYDPQIQKTVLYREVKKIKGVKEDKWSKLVNK